MISDITFEEALRVVADHADLDLAYLARTITRLGHDNVASVMSRKTKEAKTQPIPPFETLTAGQCALFDNLKEYGGIRPKRGEPGHYKAQYAVEVELWTTPEGKPILGGKLRNSAHHSKALLLDSVQLAAHLQKLASDAKSKRPWRQLNAYDDEGADLVKYAAHLLNLAKANPTMRFGPLYSASGGSTYFPWNFAVASDVGNKALMSVQLMGGNGIRNFAKFDDHMVNGQLLSGNCILQSRASNRPSDLNWQTTKW